MVERHRDRHHNNDITIIDITVSQSLKNMPKSHHGNQRIPEGHTHLPWKIETIDAMQSKGQPAVSLLEKDRLETGYLE